MQRMERQRGDDHPAATPRPLQACSTGSPATPSPQPTQASPDPVGGSAPAGAASQQRQHPPGGRRPPPRPPWQACRRPPPPAGWSPPASCPPTAAHRSRTCTSSSSTTRCRTSPRSCGKQVGTPGGAPAGWHPQNPAPRHNSPASAALSSCHPTRDSPPHRTRPPRLPLQPRCGCAPTAARTVCLTSCQACWGRWGPPPPPRRAPTTCQTSSRAIWTPCAPMSWPTTHPRWLAGHAGPVPSAARPQACSMAAARLHRPPPPPHHPMPPPRWPPQGVPLVDLSSDQDTTDLTKCVVYVERHIAKQQAAAGAGSGAGGADAQPPAPAGSGQPAASAQQQEEPCILVLGEPGRQGVLGHSRGHGQRLRHPFPATSQPHAPALAPT